MTRQSRSLLRSTGRTLEPNSTTARIAGSAQRSPSARDAHSWALSLGIRTAAASRSTGFETVRPPLAMLRVGQVFDGIDISLDGSRHIFRAQPGRKGHVTVGLR